MITVYTTRPDTLHGATFMVLSPEHALAQSLATPENADAVAKYIAEAANKSNVDRMQSKEKTGVFTGSYAVNPLNGALVPIWLSDYVLADYGTGAIMCVPAHDDRDFEFAKKFNIPIIQVIAKDGKEIENMTEAYTEAAGTMINSGEWNGMESSVLKKEAPAHDRGRWALAVRQPTTSSVTGYSPVSVTGVNRSRSYTARNVVRFRFRKISSRYFCRM